MATITKPFSTVNDSRLHAVDLDGSFDLSSNADIVASTTVPHATVNASTFGGIEYYKFTVQAHQTIAWSNSTERSGVSKFPSGLRPSAL